jgi:hypothetical protein
MRCRKGDMAMIIKSPTGASIGKMVEVVVQPDAWMMPIRPGDLDETQETEKELEVAK